MTARKLIQRIHLWLGFICGTLLFFVALTGCVMAFEDELRFATQHHLLYIAAEDTPRLSVQRVIEEVKAYDPKVKLNQIRFFGDPSRTVHCYTRDKKIVSVNPYNGSITGVRDNQKDWLSLVLSFHRTLLLGETGERIILWNAWIFLFMLLSGLVLWLPPRFKLLKQNLVIKRGLAPKKRNYDMHRILGLYAWLPLLLIVITGISMGSGGEKGPKLQSSFMAGTPDAGIYDRVVNKAYHQEPLDVLRVTFPTDSAGVITIGIRYATSSFRRQSNFMFDQYSGKLLKTDLYQQKSFWQRFFGSSYELHTGRIIGIPGKIIMFMAGLIALSLPVTGFLIWWNKRQRSPQSTVHRPRLVE